MAGDTVKLPLDATVFELTCTPGDDLNFAFEGDVDMTDWTLGFDIWVANDNGDGPTGDTIANLTEGSGITLTPGATSTIAIAVAGSVTENYLNQILWGRLKRTDTGANRTFAKGQILPV